MRTTSAQLILKSTTLYVHEVTKQFVPAFKLPGSVSEKWAE